MEARMAQRQQRGGADPEKRHEAENLAREAVEELDHGNKEEGKFLAEEARELDRTAADAVLKEGKHAGERAKPAGQGNTAKPEHTAGKSSGSGSHPRAAAKHGTQGHEQRGGSARRTTDHDHIRAWVEERGGRPSVVKRSHNTEEGGGILRIDFAEPEASLEEVDWEEFFATFEDRKLAFLHQDRTADGQLSRFFKFVRRDQEDEEENQA
jgi:hypothetical protein